MPSPRPSGSGILKILPFPHRLQDEFFDLVAFPSYLSEPRVHLVFRRFLGSSSLRRFRGVWGVSTGPSTVLADVAILLAVIALYLLQISSLPLSLEIAISRGKRGSCIGFVLLLPFCPHPSGIPIFYDTLSYSSAIGRGIHGIWISARGNSSRR